MKKILLILSAALISVPGAADDNTTMMPHHAGGDMAHGEMNHDHSAQHEHAINDANNSAMMSAPALTKTDEISAALANGGAPVVVDVLGVVCDFCAVAMNKIFGKRDEVSALYVDLNKKTLSLVVHKGASLSDQDIEILAKKAGYRIAAIRRDAAAMGG